MSASVKCLQCKRVIEERDDDLDVGDLLYCSICDLEFEIIAVAPVRLKACSTLDGYFDNADASEEDSY
ncbi:MAG: hypothetical protein ABII88_04015 [Candidatus Omnitrophota bacterium]